MSYLTAAQLEHELQLAAIRRHEHRKTIERLGLKTQREARRAIKLGTATPAQHAISTSVYPTFASKL